MKGERTFIPECFTIAGHGGSNKATFDWGSSGFPGNTFPDLTPSIRMPSRPPSSLIGPTSRRFCKAPRWRRSTRNGPWRKVRA